MRDVVAAAHVVAREVAIVHERFEQAHDGRLGQAGGAEDVADGSDAELVHDPQDFEHAARGLDRRVRRLRLVGRAVAGVGAAAAVYRPTLRRSFARRRRRTVILRDAGGGIANLVAYQHCALSSRAVPRLSGRFHAVAAMVRTTARRWRNSL